MSAKTSKEVTNRQRSCHFLLTAFERQGNEVSGQLAETLVPMMAEGQSAPEVGPVVDAFGVWLGALIDRLVEHDETLYGTNARLGKVRRVRDAAVTELVQEISRLRLSIENQYRSPKLDRLGFETPISRSPMPLLRQARRLVEALGSEELGDLLGPPNYAQPFDPSTHRQELQTHVDRVSETVHQIDALQRDFDRALIDKRRTMGEHDEVFLHTARVFESLCRLVKESELAERVRLSPRRAGRPPAFVHDEVPEGSEGGVDAGGAPVSNDNMEPWTPSEDLGEVLAS